MNVYDQSQPKCVTGAIFFFFSFCGQVLSLVHRWIHLAVHTV
jgi:hypothetical protein